MPSSDIISGGYYLRRILFFFPLIIAITAAVFPLPGRRLVPTSTPRPHAQASLRGPRRRFRANSSINGRLRGIAPSEVRAAKARTAKSELSDELINTPSPSSMTTTSAVATSAVATAVNSIKQAASSSCDVIKTASEVFKSDELRQALMPTLEKLYRQDPESLPFRQPVDPQLLQIPDYFDIIKTPMDLSTIKRQLDTGQYQNPWQYVHDVWLMFGNAWLYNKKTSHVFKFCTKLSEVFVQEIDPVMQSLGYCCGRKYEFQPQVLCCYGKQLCTIPRDAKYMCYQNKITYCIKCFSEIPGDTVNDVEAGSSGSQTVTKNQFNECKNDHLEPEPFVDCKECGRKLHRICVLHLDSIWTEGFVCDSCWKVKGKKRKENRFNAKRLPQSKLGSYIETRVNYYLQKNNSGAGEVSIRVVSSSDKIVEVKEHMKRRFVVTGEWPESFPYRAKSVFAFQNIRGVDVCFFGMHVQEYGSDCKAPNARRVYIAYLDSVHFFTPKQYKTAVYHEILLNYLAYAKQLGYTMVHIWACPPQEGDDYIFFSHPPEQKMPKEKRLQDWYKKMLDKGIRRRILFRYTDIWRQAFLDDAISLTDLPYFDGDFWPKVIEETAIELEKREKGHENSKSSLEPIDLSLTTKKAKGKRSKASKKKGAVKQTEAERELFDKVYLRMEQSKELFIVIRLHPKDSEANLPSIIDPDPALYLELMDVRDSLLLFAKTNRYEFSSLRRTMYSSLALIRELHVNFFAAVTRYLGDFSHCRACEGTKCNKVWCQKMKATLHDQDEYNKRGRKEPIDRKERYLLVVHLCNYHNAYCTKSSCSLAICNRRKARRTADSTFSESSEEKENSKRTKLSQS